MCSFLACAMPWASPQGQDSYELSCPSSKPRPNAAVAEGKPKLKPKMPLTVYDITCMLETSASEATSWQRLARPETVVKVQHVQRLLWFYHVSVSYTHLTLPTIYSV